MSKHKPKPIVPFAKGTKVIIAGVGVSETGTVVFDSGRDQHVLITVWSKKKNAYVEHLVSRPRLKLPSKPGTPAP